MPVRQAFERGRVLTVASPRATLKCNSPRPVRLETLTCGVLSGPLRLR